MNVFAEGQTFLVAYPAQGSSANSSKRWNWFEETNQRRDVGEPAFPVSLIEGGMLVFYRSGCLRKNAYIAMLALGLWGSVYDPLRLPPDQAWPIPSIFQYSWVSRPWLSLQV